MALFMLTQNCFIQNIFCRIVQEFLYLPTIFSPMIIQAQSSYALVAFYISFPQWNACVKKTWWPGIMRLY